MQRSQILILLFSLFPALASAQFATPRGCYSTDSDPLSCYMGTIKCGTSSYNNSYQLGSAVGGLCDSWVSCEAELEDANDSIDICISDYNLLVDEYNSLLSEYNYLDAGFDSLSARYNACVNTVAGGVTVLESKDLLIARLLKKIKRLQKRLRG